MLFLELFFNQYIADIITAGKVTYKAFVEKNILCLENYLSQYAVLVYTQKKDESNSELVFVLFINQYVGDIINTGKVTCKAFVEKNILCLKNYLSQYTVHVYTQKKD